MNTAGAAYGLSKKYNVETPIIEHAYKILFEGMDPHEAVNLLMTRRKTVE